MVRLLLGILAWCFLVPAAGRWLLAAIHHHPHPPCDAPWVGLGLAVGLVVTLWRRPNWFLHTLLHEACHLLTASVLLVPVHRLVVSDGQGGQVEHQATGPVRSTLIALAPYTLPLVLGPLLVARMLTPEGPWRSALSALCGLAFWTHLTGLFHNLRLNLWDATGDLARSGRVLSLAVITAALMAITAGTWLVLGSAARHPLAGPADLPSGPWPAPAAPPTDRVPGVPALQPEQPLDPH